MRYWLIKPSTLRPPTLGLRALLANIPTRLNCQLGNTDTVLFFLVIENEQYRILYETQYFPSLLCLSRSGLAPTECFRLTVNTSPSVPPPPSSQMAPTLLTVMGRARRSLLLDGEILTLVFVRSSLYLNDLALHNNNGSLLRCTMY